MKRSTLLLFAFRASLLWVVLACVVYVPVWLLHGCLDRAFLWLYDQTCAQILSALRRARLEEMRKAEAARGTGV